MGGNNLCEADAGPVWLDKELLPAPSLLTARSREVPSAWGQSFAFPVNGNGRSGAPGLPPLLFYLSWQLDRRIRSTRFLLLLCSVELLKLPRGVPLADER